MPSPTSRMMNERNQYVRSANMLRKELRGRKIKISPSMDAEETFHQKRMEYVKYFIHVRHNIPPNSISLNWTSKHVSVKGQIVVKNVKVDLSSISSTKTLNLRSKINWKNGTVETVQRRRDEGKTASSQIHTTTQGNQGSDTGTSEGGGKQKLKQVDGDFPASITMKTKREQILIWKEKGGGRLKHCNVDGDVPLCLRKFDEENKDSSSSSKKEQQRTDGERKQRFEQHEEE